MKCSICDKEIPVKDGGWDSGNNAQPVNDGRCCDDCNMSVVIPARLHALSNRQDEEDDEYWLYLLTHNGYCRVVGEDDNWSVAHQMTGETGRLFAAAQELLAALRPFADLIENPDAFPDGMHQWWVDTADVRRAVSAIAKAEGRTADE